MTRYIDADLLLTDEKTHTLPIGCGKASGNVVVFVDDIEKLTTADVQKVRHGRWVNKGDYAVCTECGERSGTQYDGVEPIPLMTKFCSNCGAKMDESATDIFVGTY